MNMRLFVVILAILVCFMPVLGDANGRIWDDVSMDTGGDILCLNGENGTDKLYAGTKKGVYISRDIGENWERASLFTDRKNSEEIEYVDEVVRKEKEKGGRNLIDATGLSLSDYGYDVAPRDQIFISEGSRVFLCSEKTKTKQVVFEEPYARDISLLIIHKDSRGVQWIFAISGRRIYRTELSELLDGHSSRIVGLEPALTSKQHMPSAIEVHNMAIEYAEVSPEKIKKWRTEARWKAVMPILSLGFSESTDDNIEIYKSASRTYVVEGPKESGSDWSVDLRWDLSDLVWNNVQTSIDVRSKLMVQLREDLLEEVTRLYFERKKLMLEIDAREKSLPGDVTSGELFSKRIRMEELTAYIDALTGGQFSRSLRE